MYSLVVEELKWLDGWVLERSSITAVSNNTHFYRMAKISIVYIRTLLVVLVFTIKVKSLSCVQLFATPWTRAYQAPPSMGFFQARALEWVATSFSRGSSWPRDRTQVSHIVGRRFTIWATREIPVFTMEDSKRLLTESVIQNVFGLFHHLDKNFVISFSPLLY